MSLVPQVVIYVAVIVVARVIFERSIGMTGKEIYKATKQFPVKLMMVGLIKSVICIALAGLIVLIGWLTKAYGFIFVGILLVLILSSIASGIIEHYITYMFKHGAVYAISRACLTGGVSANYFEESVDFIKNHFLSANVYLVVDKMVSRAVRGVTKLVSFVIGFLPDNIKNVVNSFVNAYLNYIDECCLAYSMCHPDVNVGKTSCDAVVLYYQDAKNMLKPAAKVVLRRYVTLGVFYVIGLLCLLIPVPFFNYIIAVTVILIGTSVYAPFLDHHILCDIIPEYLGYALNNEPKADIYATLQKVNPFRKLQEKMNDPEWTPAPGNSAYTAAYVHAEETGAPQAAAAETDIPMPQAAPSQEEVLWQKAWNRMTADQRNMYQNMDEAQRTAWKKQILKQCFNYEA